MFQLLSFSPCLNELCMVCNPQVPISISRLSSSSRLCSSGVFKNDKVTFGPSEKTCKILFFSILSTQELKCSSTSTAADFPIKELF